jgi:hypothetical protein
MRTTVTLDPDIFAVVSQISRTTGERLGQVISDLVRRALNPAPALQIVQEGRFAAFAVPENGAIGAGMMDPEQVQRVLDEEGF